jgi:hypothetical protein
MDKNPLIRKSFAVGIILIFLGTYIIPSSAMNKEKPVLLPFFKGWMKTFGRPNSTNYGDSVQQTTDGGYIIAGATMPVDSIISDIWVIKTDRDGNKVWDKTFGGSNWDYPSDIKQTNDNGFLITGRTYSFGAGMDDVWVLKLDQNGNVQWNKTFGTPFLDFGWEGQQTTDGGYIIVGSVCPHEAYFFDIWLIKLDGEGNEQWNRTFGEPTQYPSDNFGRSVQQTSDGGYIFAGSSTGYGVAIHTSAFWLIKTDVQGNEQWNRTYGAGNDDQANSVELTSDGGYIIVGNKYDSDSQQSDIWIIKTNQYGDEQWNKTYGGTGDDYGRQAYQTTDGGYIMIGTTQPYGDVNSYAWMIKLDNSGNEQWNRTYGGKSGGMGNSVALTSDRGYIITGYTSEDVWLIKTDSHGKSTSMSLGNLWFERLFERFSNAFPTLQHFWNGKI